MVELARGFENPVGSAPELSAHVFADASATNLSLKDLFGKEYGGQNLVIPAEFDGDSIVFTTSDGRKISVDDFPTMGGVFGMHPPKFDEVEVPIDAKAANATSQDFQNVDEKIGKMLGFLSSGGTNFDPKNGEQLYIDNKEFRLVMDEWAKVKDQDAVIAYLRNQSTVRPASLDVFRRTLEVQLLPFEMTRAKYAPAI